LAQVEVAAQDHLLVMEQMVVILYLAALPLAAVVAVERVTAQRTV
jgi:hypothetical protein